MKLRSWIMYCLLGFTCISQGQPALKFTQIINTPDQVIGAEILITAYARLKIPIEIIPMPGKRALIESSNGRLDGEVHRIIDVAKEYPSLLRVPTSINYIEPTVFSNKKNLFIDGCQSLKSYKIGRTRGVKHAEICTKGMGNVIVYSDSIRLIDNLILNRVDLIITAKVNGLMHLKKIGNQTIRALSPSLSHLPVYHYLHKKHVHLVPQIDKVFKNMKGSGELEVIRKTVVLKMLKEAEKN